MLLLGRIGARIGLTAVLVALWPASLSAATAPPFTQCPAIGADHGCQLLLTLTDSSQQFQTDPSQPPYENADDSLIGIQNGTSAPLSSLTLSATSAIFGFELDGLCDSGSGPAPSGCALPPAVAADSGAVACNPSTTQFNYCSFPPPPGEPPNHIEPGAFANPGGPSGSDSTAWPNGDVQNGYEGPTSWFDNVSTDTTTGTVHFSPPIPVGGSTYFSIETPPAGQAVGTGSSTTLTTNLTATPVGGAPSSGATLSVPIGTPVTDQATLTGTSLAGAQGSVTYSIFSDSACTTPVGTPTMVPVGTGGSVPPGPTLTSLPLGTYFLQASYSGDLNHQPSMSACGGETLTIVPQPPLPPPVLGTSFNFMPVSGVIFVKLPSGGAADGHAAALTKGAGFVQLTQPRQLPAGTQVDSRAGTIRLGSRAVGPGGRVQAVTLGGAIFSDRQRRSGLHKGLTVMTLLEGVFPGAPSFSQCGPYPAGDGPPATLAASPMLQTLHASEKGGKFGTNGKYSAGVVQGTVWDTSDLCNGTLTVVHRGVVAVFDKVRRKTILVHAGQQYLARARP
jgi:hypothetical protein